MDGSQFDVNSVNPLVNSPISSGSEHRLKGAHEVNKFAKSVFQESKVSDSSFHFEGEDMVIDHSNVGGGITGYNVLPPSTSNIYTPGPVPSYGDLPPQQGNINSETSYDVLPSENEWVQKSGYKFVPTHEPEVRSKTGDYSQIPAVSSAKLSKQESIAKGYGSIPAFKSERPTEPDKLASARKASRFSQRCLNQAFQDFLAEHNLSLSSHRFSALKPPY